MIIPARQVRAVYDDRTIVVYQAFSDAIAEAALAAGTFVEPFSMSRMTWIKPSFLWMMYRCGWASKPGQERVLAIRMLRSGFERALSESCLSHFDPTVHVDHEAWRAAVSSSPVRVQWDPERTADGRALPHRSLQIGLSGSAVNRYVGEWITDVEDVTARLADLRSGTDPLPAERPYPLPPDVAAGIGATG